MNRRQVLTALFGYGSWQKLGAQAMSIPPIRGESFTVPITDGTGKIEYRFQASSGVVSIDVGEGQAIQMACVPEGTGLMGSVEPWSNDGPQSTPIHSVQVQAFLLGKFEVTVGQWLRASRLPKVSVDLPSPFTPAGNPNPERWPIEIATFFQAEEFCRRMERLTGFAFRLPSEAEWEYACRASTTTRYHFGDGFGAEPLTSEVLLFQRFVPVGSKNAPNRFGLHDMHGGVGEWCSDWNHPDYKGAPSDGSPWFGPSGDSQFRIHRGTFLRMGSAGRASFPAAGSATLLGFRVALSYNHGIVDPRLQEIVHGASLQPGSIAPLQMIFIRGERIGPETGMWFSIGSESDVSTTLGDTQVLFDETAAPILFVSKEQILVITPANISSQRISRIVVKRGYQSSHPLTVSVEESAPALFTADRSGSGPVAAFNVDGSINSNATPASRGSVVSLYGTGFGEMSPKLRDGKVTNEGLPRPTLSVRAEIGGREASIEYSGQAPEMPLGLVQLNVRVPEFSAVGEVAFALEVGTRRSPIGTTLFVK